MKKTPPEIRILTDDVANKIAAGEVIERPAAVAKELMENSIDAGATRIDIEFKNGGKSFIKIADNGCGMTREQALMSLEAHATSKISQPDDLFKITSYGFRGEAVPSIASVSKFCMRTRPQISEAGTQIDVYAGEVKSIRECGMPEGTEVLVENLFCSVPARRKFLKSDNVEASHITKLCRLYALALPNLAITLIENSRVIFRSERNLGIVERVGRIFGSEIGDKLIELRECKLGDMSVSGAILKAGESFATSRNICAFINSRPVDCRAVYSAIKDAYAQYLPKGRYAAAFLFINLDPATVDVNVHPAKREVRLKNEFAVRDFLYECLSKKLAAYTLVAAPDSFRLDESEPEKPLESVLLQASKDDVIKRELPAPKFSPSLPRATVATDNLSGNCAVPSVSPSKPIVSTFERSKSLGSDTGDVLAKGNEEASNNSKNFVEQPRSEESTADVKSADTPKFAWRYIGCMHKKYAIFESQKGIVMMSVSAALKRVHYERASKSLRSKTALSQRLLIPLNMKFDRADGEFFDINSEAFRSCGFEIEEFGTNFYRIYSAPDWLPFGEIEKFVREFIETAREDGKNIKKCRLSDDAFARLLASKVNMTGFMCSESSAQTLLAELLLCPSHMVSPDGKPTLKELSDAEIGRMFGT